MERYLRSILGPDPEADTAATYLLQHTTGSVALQHWSSLSRTPFHAPFQIDALYRLAPTLHPSPLRHAGQWRAHLFFPEYDLGRYAVGLFAEDSPPALAFHALAVDPRQWRIAYLHCRFAYDRMERWITKTVRFGMDRRDGDGDRVHGGLVMRWRSEPAVGLRTREVVVFRFAAAAAADPADPADPAPAPDAGTMVCTMRVDLACGHCAEPYLRCLCPGARGDRMKTLRHAAQLQINLPWEELLHCYRRVDRDDAGVFRTDVHSTIRSPAGTLLARGTTLFRTPDTISQLGLAAIQVCFPGSCAVPLVRVSNFRILREFLARAQTTHSEPSHNSRDLPSLPPEPSPPVTPEDTATAPTRDPADEFFPCPFCSRVFSRRCNMERHVQAVHLGTRPFQCDLCHFRFQHKQHLKSHVESQHHAVTVRCNVCAKTFKSNSNLRRHVKTVHNIRPASVKAPSKS